MKKLTLLLFAVLLMTPSFGITVGGVYFDDIGFVDAIGTYSGTWSGTLSNIIGTAPLNNPSSPTYIYSNDTNAYLNLLFTNNVVRNGSGADLAIFEASGAGSAGSTGCQIRLTINSLTKVYTPTWIAGTTYVSYVNLDDFGIASGSYLTSIQIRGYTCPEYVAVAALYPNLPQVLSSSNTNFGNVRVGTSGTASVTVSNTGASGSTLTGTIGSASGSEFAPTSGNQSFSLGYNQSASRTYTYTPSARGTDSTNVSITSDGGNATKTLTGTGVSPVYSSSVAPNTTIDFGTVDKDQTLSRTLTIQNITPDADLGNLTNLTLISATISGADASYFSLANFTPGMVLSKNGSFDLGITVNNPDHLVSMRYATLTIVTDVNSAFGVAGNVYTYQLQAYTVPEPSTCIFMSLVCILLGFSRFYRKN